MESWLKAVARKLVPGSLRAARIRAKAMLLLEQPTIEIQCRQDFLNHAFRALSYNGIGGDYVEFGCHGGTTFGLAYQAARKHGHSAHFWAYDSFCGLPASVDARDEHPHWQPGNMSTALEDFRRICAGNGIPAERYTTVPGMYSDTLDGLPPDAPPTDISLAYIDCDMYMSTRSVLGFLMPRLKHGMIIAFDDYFCWSSSHVSGERRAMLEFFTDSSDWRLLPYVQYNWAGASFVVEKRLDREPTVQG